MKKIERLALMGMILVLTTGCDQATKQIAMAELKGAPRQSYLGDLFRLEYAQNPGAFLSLGAGLSDQARQSLFIAAGGTTLVALLSLALFYRRLNPLSIAALAMIAGGGIGNWIDRVLRGNQVIDFMNLGVGPLRTGIFNVADLFIVAGVATLALAQLRPGDAGRDRVSGRDELS